MHFDDRKGHGLDAVVQPDAVLGQGRRVENASVDVVDVGLQRIEQRALVVGLEGLDVDIQLGGEVTQAGIDLG